MTKGAFRSVSLSKSLLIFTYYSVSVVPGNLPLLRNHWCVGLNYNANLSVEGEVRIIHTKYLAPCRPHKSPPLPFSGHELLPLRV